jgi:hypothetical protein
LVVLWQLAWIAWREHQSGYARKLRGCPLVCGPLLLSAAVAWAFAIRGCPADASFQVGNLWLLVLLVAVGIVYGLLLQSAWAAWIAALVSLTVGFQIYRVNPFGVLDGNDLLNLWLLGWLAASLIWQAYYGVQRARRAATIRRWFLTFSWFTTFVSVWWMLIVALLERATGILYFSSPAGCVALLLTTILIASNVWNDRARFRVLAPFVLMLVPPVLVLNRLELPLVRWAALSLFGAACATLFWGQAYRRRSALRWIGKRWHVPRLAALERAWYRQLPAMQCSVLVAVASAAWVFLFLVDDRLVRYVSAVTPLLLGAALVPLAHWANWQGATRQGATWQWATSQWASRRGLQWIVAASMTLGVVFLSWADMSSRLMAWQSFPLPVRTTLSLGLVVFIQGWVLPRRI